MYNKNTYRKTNDKKLLHKIGKRWVTVSIAMLALLGGSFAMKSVTTHADTITPAVEAQNTNHVKKQLNNGFARAYQANKSASANTIASSGAKSVASNSAPTSATRTNNIQSQAGRMYRGLMLNATRNPQKQSESIANSNVASSGSSKVSQPASNSDSGNGMTTLKLGSPSQQTRGWNFVQHGIRNNDYASVNNSGSSSVNNSASGNQTAPASSSNAKSNTVSAPIHQTNQNSLNSLNAKLKAMEPSTNASSSSSVASANAVNANSNSNNNNENKALLKSTLPDYDHNFIKGTNVHTGTDDGLNYVANNQGNVEFVNGTANSDLSNFASNSFISNASSSDVKNAKCIKFDNNIDTSGVTNMSDMFRSDYNLQSLILPNSFNTSKVSDMSGMFRSDYNLQSLTLPNSFDTSSVTNMSNMFNGDSALKSLDVSNFNTSKVSDMSGMFCFDNNLQSLTLPNPFDTSSVTNMSNMFFNDSNLQSLTLPTSFNTSGVTNMSGMFNGDNNLQSLTLPSSFNTSKVSDMSSMFNGDNNLQSLTLPTSFNTSGVTNMSGMFEDDAKLSTQNIQDAINKMNTSKVSDMSNMFRSDYNLQSFTLPNSFNTSGVTNMSNMFFNDSNLQSLTLPNSFNTSKVSNMSSMFEADNNLQSLTLPNSFNTSGVTNMSDMFNGDNNLQSLTLPNSFNTSKVSNMSSMFENDAKLSTQNIQDAINKMNTSDVTNMSYMFYNDSNLQSLTLPDSFNTSGVTNMSHMFFNDSNLQSLTLPNSFNTSGVTNMSHMFNGDAELKSITIQSSNTKFTDNNDFNSRVSVQSLYKKDTNDSYTSTTSNNFTQGNVGTFIPENSAPSSDTATINFQANGKSIKSYTTPKEKFGSTTTAGNVSSTLPSDYQIINPIQVITYNGSTQNVAVRYIPSEWDTISYEYQPNSNQSNYYEVINQGQAYGRQGSNYTIQSSDVPAGYQLVNPNDNSFAFGNSDGFHRIMIKPSTNSDIPAIPNTVNIKGTVTLHFSDKSNGNKTRDIKLDYLTQDSDAKQINVLGDVDYNNGANTKPTDFLGKTIQGFDTTNFTYNGSNNVGYYTPNQSDTDYDHGSTRLLDHDVTLYFTAKQGTNPVQNGSNDTIEYTDGNGKVIGSTVVNGHTGSKFTPNANVPEGYHLAPNQSSIDYDGSTHNVEVEGNTIPNTAIITVKQSNGTTTQIPVKGHKIGDKITINPSQYAPKGYSPDSNDNPITVTIVPSKNQSGYSFQPSGNDTDPNATNNVFKGNTVSYNYHYDPNKAGNTVTVKYRNHAGKIVGTKTFNEPQGTKINPNSDAPSDYTNDGTNNKPITAPSDGNSSTVIYNVKGTKSASQLPSTTNRGKVELHIVEKDNDNQTNSYNVQVDEGSKLVGSDFTIDPTQSTDINGNKLVPKGYASDGTDKIITGVITDNGAVTDSGTDTLIYDAQGKNGCNIHYQNPSNPNDTSKDIVVPTNNDKTGQHLTNADVPNGYHLPSDTSFSFNSDGHIIDDKTGQQLPNNRVPLEGNDIQGKANIVLKYQILDPTGKNVVKTIYNNADDAQVILNGQVGGSQTINPWRYWKKDFTIPSGVANQSDTIHFTPSDDNANDENGQQFNPTLTYTATAQQAGDVAVQYVDVDNIDPVTKKPQPIMINNKPDTQDLGNFNDLVGQTVRLGQKEPSDNDANINNDSNVQYVLEVPQGYHLEYNSNPITLGVGKMASSNPAVRYPKSGLGMLFNASRFYHRPVGLFLTVGLSRPVMPNKPKSSASASSSSSASVKPSSATSVTPSSASSASSSANSSTSVTSSGNTYISNISYISYVTNNYSSSANTANSYANASTANPVITPVVNPIVTPTVNPTTESTTTTTVESASAKPTEVVNNDNDNNTIYNISGSKADKLVQRIPVGSKVYHKKVTIKRLSQKKLGMYYIMVTRPTWIYRGTRFTRRNRIRVLKPKDIIAVPIQRIFRINGRMVFQIRIHVSRHHNSAFITGNHRYVRNAYIQPKELRGHHYVRVLRNAELYRSPRYSNRTRVGNVYRGAKLRVKRIRYIASKHMTRIQLTNGRWFTANKNFVKIIK